MSHRIFIDFGAISGAHALRPKLKSPFLFVGVVSKSLFAVILELKSGPLGFRKAFPHIRDCTKTIGVDFNGFQKPWRQFFQILFHCKQG